MAYIALYRKWRPQTFRDLVGQEHVSRTLSQAIAANKIAHAYLFAGPRGTGKTSAAKIFAKAVNCEKGPTPDPCGECASCKKITDGASMDVFEIDAASNRGIEEIRDLQETVKFAPVDGRFKVYIIDEVHMLTAEAFNALLKTLEEPPPSVLFILATTEAHKVPVTIQSRCQRYDFKRIGETQIAARLKFVADETGIAVDDAALKLVAEAADGGLRDALGILDQAWSLAEDRITEKDVAEILGLIDKKWILDLTDAIMRKKSEKILAIVAKLVADGKDLRQLLTQVSLHLRDLMVFKATGATDILSAKNIPVEVLNEQSMHFSHEEIISHIGRINDALGELKWTEQPRITTEVALLSLAWEKPFAEKETARIVAQTMPPPRPAQNPAAKVSQPAPVAAPTPSVNKKDETPAQPAPQPPPAKNAPAMPTAEVWSRLLGELKARRKLPAEACLKQGRPVNMTATELFVEFPSDIFVSMASSKYKTLAESIIAETTGKNISLVCGTAEKKTPPQETPNEPPKKNKPASKDASIKIDTSSMGQKEKSVIENAIEIFGDNIVAVEGED